MTLLEWLERHDEFEEKLLNRFHEIMTEGELPKYLKGAIERKDYSIDWVDSEQGKVFFRVWLGCQNDEGFSFPFEDFV
jgi:hypothetical protein